MKNFTLILAAALGAAMAHAETEVITLDLTKSTTPLEFNETNGAWTGTYDDEATSIDSQCFSFVHNSMGEYQTWWGFTASNHADNSRPENTLTHQFSNMACGGIVLNEDGTVKTDAFGAPVTDAGVPYMVGFFNAYFSARPTDMAFAGGKSYKAVGVYVNLNTYAYYSIEYGDAYTRPFTNGDRFTLTIHGVRADGSEKSVDVILAGYSNGDLTINRGWRYVDLSELGEINEMYFTMTSTDSGEWGMNTPGYFCLDKLMVSPAEGSSLQQVQAASTAIDYDRSSHTVTLSGADFAMVSDASGRTVMSAEGTRLNVSHLPAGIYLVKAGDSTLKIVK